MLHRRTGAELQAARERARILHEAGATQKGIAKILGVSQGRVSQLLHGHR
jgi:predicted transcriptional regulator